MIHFFHNHLCSPFVITNFEFISKMLTAFTHFLISRRVSSSTQSPATNRSKKTPVKTSKASG